MCSHIESAAVQIIASKKQIEAKYKQSKEAVAMWQSRAELAVQAGQDELAREALKKRKANEEQLGTWQQQLDQQSQAVDQLLGNTRAMEAKLAEAKSKKETLKARAASAKSSKQVCRFCAPSWRAYVTQASASPRGVQDVRTRSP